MKTPPNGPFCTKNTTESKFRYGESIRYGGSKTLRRVPRNAYLTTEKGQETIQIIKVVGA